MQKINSINNEYIRNIKKLHQKKYREQTKMFLVEGYHLVEEALKGSCLETVLICNESDKVLGVDNILVNKEIIESIAQSKSPQAIVGVCHYLPQAELTGKRFLLLEDINDPGNMGALIRSALGFKIDCIIVSPNTVDIYNEKVIRSSQGALFKVPILRKDLLKTIVRLKKSGNNIYATSVQEAAPLSSFKNIKDYALVLGNESHGVSNEVFDCCDFIINVETNSQLESLNVVVAGSIIMYYFLIS